MLSAMFGFGPTELVVIALVLLVPATVVAGIVFLAIWLGKRSPQSSQAEMVASLMAENRRLREQLEQLQRERTN